MARRKKHNPMLIAMSLYIQKNFPEMAHALPRLRMLDGPPGSPRYAVTVESCDVAHCPHTFSTQAGATQPCQVHDCPLRRSLRLLVDRRGVVVQTTQSGIHWS